MKTLTTTESINLLPCDDELAAKAIVRLEDLLPTNDSIDDLQNAVTKNLVQCRTVSKDGKLLFVIWYQFNGNTIQCAGASVSSEDNFETLMIALEMLAKQHNCQWIEFRTKRRGLARKSAHYGYSVDTINLLKRL